ncbi:MAG: hypothetical protein IPJ06_12360 [Saprospiraceae bacterium]|nr:hypothetical protein [Saprospiraceae bacterium]
MPIRQTNCKQALSYDPATQILTLENGGTVDLTSLANIPETDPEVGMNVTNRMPVWDGSALVEGTVISNNNTVSPTGSAFGLNNQATSINAVAFGFQNTANGEYSVAFGAESVASGHNSTAMGAGTQASGARSTSMGTENTASGESSTAMGYSTRPVVGMRQL